MAALNACWMGLSFMWSALHPIVLPAMLLTLVPSSSKNTYLGLLTFAGLTIAMIVQPLSGALSDRWQSRFGRRRPLLLAATIMSCLFLALLGWSGGLLWLCIGYLGLQISSNTAQGPLQGLLRDRVPPAQLGTASSIKIFFDLLSLVAAGLVAGNLLETGTRGPSVVILVILGLVVVSAAITILFSAEAPARPAPQVMQGPAPQPSALAEGWTAGYRSLIAERGMFLLGVYGLQAFGQYYLGDVLHVPDPARQAGSLIAVVGAGTVVLVLAGGWLTDRLGAKRLLYAATLGTSVGLLFMGFARNTAAVMALGGLVGGGVGLFLTSNWALANRLAPEAQAGKFLGLTNLATAGSAALARLQGPAVDFLNSSRPGDWIGYRGVFVFGAACVLASTYFLSRIGRSTA